MNGQATLTIWQLLLLALAAPILTGIITLGLPYVQEAAKKKKERVKLLLEKLEEAMTLLQEQDHWHQLQRNKVAFGENLTVGSSPLNRMSAIAFIYFPELGDLVHQARITSSGYEVKLSEAAIKRLEGRIAEIGDGMADSNKEYLAKQGALLVKMQLIGEKLSKLL